MLPPMTGRWLQASDIGQDFLFTVLIAGEGDPRTVRVRATLRAVEPDGYRVEIRSPWLDAASERAWAERHASPEVGSAVHLAESEIEVAEPIGDQ
jgi:hypothetical protein